MNIFVKLVFVFQNEFHNHTSTKIGQQSASAVFIEMPTVEKHVYQTLSIIKGMIEFDWLSAFTRYRTHMYVYTCSY